MSKLWIAVLAGAGGFALGVFVTKTYAENQVKGTVHDTLDKIGLGGGVVESIADKLVLG